MPAAAISRKYQMRFRISTHMHCWLFAK